MGPRKSTQIVWWMVFAALILFVAIPQYGKLWAAGNEKAQASSTKAIEFQRQGDLRSARIELMNAIKSAPDWAELRVQQAEILLGLYDAVGAEAEIKRASELGIEPSRTKHLLGNALFLQGKLTAARDVLNSNDIPSEHQGYAARILARVYMDLGDSDAARNMFNRAIALIPEDSDLWVDIARFRFAAGEQGGAIEAVDRAVELNNVNVRALQYRGELMRSQYGLGAALAWFERGLEVSPNDIGLLTEYAATLGDMGRMRDMLAASRKIISLDGRNARAFFMQSVLAARAGKNKLARVLMQKTNGQLDELPSVILVQGIIEHNGGNYNRAIERFRRLIDMQPRNMKAQDLLSRSLYLAGDGRSAIESYSSDFRYAGSASYRFTNLARSFESVDEPRQAANFLNQSVLSFSPRPVSFGEGTPLSVLAVNAQRRPNDARVMLPYIRGLLQAGNTAQALGEAQRLQQRNAGATDAHILVGDVFMAMKRYDDAISAYQEARKIRFSEPVMLRLIEAFRDNGDTVAVGQILADYLRFNPNNVPALRMMAEAHLDAQSWDVALKILRGLRVRLGDNDPLLLIGIARAYLGLGQLDDARKVAEIAYHVQPANAVVTHIYGYVLLEEGSDLEDAEALLIKAVSIAPDNPLARFHLGKAYSALGKKRQARAELSIALRKPVFPDRDQAEKLLAEL